MVYPLEINPSTKEPFIRLRKHSNVIITPPRESDIPHFTTHLNDERVHVWLSGCPYPYTSGNYPFPFRDGLLNIDGLEHAKNFVTRIKAECDSGLKELAGALKDGKPVILTHCPVSVLREMQQDGTELFLGHIGVFRSREILLENAKHDGPTNRSLPAGHPDIIWTIGDWLIPSHHRRGIMSDAIDTLINDLARPLLGSVHFTAMVLGGNEGSNKVFVKNGFGLARCITNYGIVKGFLRDLNIFERFDG